MRLLDPYGYSGLELPEPSDTDDDDEIITAAHEEEHELAEQAPLVEHLVSSPDMSTSDIDPSLRLQDSPEGWLDQPGEEAGPEEPASEESSEEAPEEYAPLVDSGGQGI
jgi:hypothetical protein